jgi:cytochrome c556
MIRTAIITSVNRMVRGQAPYDQAKVAFDQIVSSSKKFTTLYPVMPSPLPRRAYTRMPTWRRSCHWFAAA